jgi:hypothetical protein
MIAIEIIWYMKAKTKGKKANTAFKLDIIEPYDKLDWEYLCDIMGQMGFSSRWINWIMLCVETVEYSGVINGAIV